MKTKEEIIRSMCFTYRHDFGMLSSSEMRFIYEEMRGLFEKDIEPYMVFKDSPPDPKTQLTMEEIAWVRRQASRESLEKRREHDKEVEAWIAGMASGVWDEETKSFKPIKPEPPANVLVTEGSSVERKKQ